MSLSRMEYLRTFFANLGISLLAASPLLIAMATYIRDVNYWNVELSYGLIYVVIPISFAILVGFAYTEARLRNRLFSALRRFPWFSTIYLLGLLTFFSVAEWARPFVLQKPDWCRVSQTIRWEDEDDSWYVLVLGGTGNSTEHALEWGYLNTSDPVSSIPAINLRPIRFGDADASLTATRRILQSPTAEAASTTIIAEDIWRLLKCANNREPLSSSDGIVAPLFVAPDADWDARIGGVAWMLCVLSAFIIVSQAFSHQSKKPT